MKPIRRFTLYSGFAALFTLAGAADAQKSETGKEPAGCVWKLSDGDSTVYLAGSVHLLRETDYPLPPVFDMVYADSEKVFFEIDMATITSVSAAVDMQKLGTYPPGETLEDHISEETHGRIIDYFKSRKTNLTAAMMSPQVINQYKPGMIYLTMSAIEAQELGAKPELGLEMQYYKRSKRDDKPSGGLETIAYQISRFNEFKPEELESLISEMLDQLDEAPKMIDAIIKSWHAGDTKALDAILNDQMSEGEGGHRLRELLLTERNQNWIPHIEEALEESENVLFIVGAAHLIGKDSVIDLLRKKGYKVERVDGGTKLRKAA